MTVISRSALVMHSAEQMFDLINDVRAYPQFLLGCHSVEVIDESDDFIEARLTLAKAGLKHSFTTRNQLQRPYVMEIVLVEGPFKTFTGKWQFQALSAEACKVTLDMQFEVESRLAGVALSALFKQMANVMVDSFVKRAKKIYG